MVSSNEDCVQCKILSQILQESMESVKALNSRVTDLKIQLLTLQSQIHQDVMNVEYDIGNLKAELDKKNAENEDLKAQLQEVLSRDYVPKISLISAVREAFFLRSDPCSKSSKFKDLKIKAERRAKLLHHVMAEYNAMTKEYEIMKSETTVLQQKNTEMYELMMKQEKQIEQLEQSVQVLEAENNELRRSRIIDASTKQWYGECNHSCSKHPRSYPHLSVHGHLGEVIPEGDPCPPCDICTEAEAWAQGLMDTAPKFSDSLRKNFQSTLPLRLRPPLYQSSSSTPLSTMKKGISDSSKDEKGKLSETEFDYDAR
ncbi:hypothetical protein ACTXT7_012174 [Hymenolepis weldensis]